MAILHGSWIPEEKEFFIWGETWRRIDAQAFPQSDQILAHPFGMTPAELVSFIASQTQRTGKELASSNESSLTLPEAALNLPDSPSKSATGGRKRKKRNDPEEGATGESVPAPRTQAKSSPSRWRSQIISFPTQMQPDGSIPVHSANPAAAMAEGLCLYPWAVQGLWLTPTETLTFLKSVPLGAELGESSTLGSDLRYWSHVGRWGLDLLARTKFVPALTQSEETTTAHWQLLLDSAVDQGRLSRFAQQMPLACRTYQAASESSADLSQPAPRVETPPSSQNLLFSFLGVLVDVQVRAIAHSQPLPNSSVDQDIPIREWLQAMIGSDRQVRTSPAIVSRLQEALATWTAPLQNLKPDQSAMFRTCLVLQPPPKGELNWTLTYCLQAADDPQFLIESDIIWQNPVDQLHHQGRLLEHPQESLLAGLGRAARLYNPIKESLKQRQPHSCQLDPIQAYEFIKSTAWRLQDSGFGIVLPGNLANQEEGGLTSRLGLKIAAKAPSRKQRQRLGLKSLLNFTWDLTIGGQEISKADFEQLINRHTPLVEINGEWVELRPQDVKAAQSFFDRPQQASALSVEDALRISTGDTQTIDKLPVVSFEATGALKDLIATLTTGNQTLKPVTEPEGFQGQLRPYQARGVSWLAFLEQWGLGACLADDMGLGKTIQLIAFLMHLRQQSLLDQPTLLVCPTSVIGNWEREVRRFAPPLKTMVYHGDKRPHGSSFIRKAEQVDLVITSYSLVHRDLKDLKRIEWQGLVLDEAQNIKNASAKQSQAVRQLDSQFRIVLTGTPVENRLSELWSILDFLNPGYLGAQNFFQRRFGTPIERYGDTASLKMLRGLVQPFILRRLKTDRSIIQDLPEKQEMAVFCALSAEQASLYQKLVDESLAAIDDAEGVKRRGLILALLTKLKQVCNHPAQFLQQKTLGVRNRSGKLQRLDEMLEEVIAEGDRALIFTQFAEWGKLLKPHLERLFRQETLFLYGGSSQKDREEMVDRFQLDPNGPKLFILSLKAGGVGLNLTRANHVFHFDRWWNPAVENQATDRVFRIGQTRNVQVHKFVCTGTLEDRIHELIESKKALSEQVVGSGEQWLTELDTDQLRDLLFLDRNAVID
ncbi:MAG: DEAD/DEAH box helicase [Leptolyngbyaceae cyanobacterium MO_188.B28]|nr:DEAD/DEAH box helicase [Leptolyngbyaceae cyanobacterium MO_188.B28]